MGRGPHCMQICSISVLSLNTHGQMPPRVVKQHCSSWAGVERHILTIFIMQSTSAQDRENYWVLSTFFCTLRVPCTHQWDFAWSPQQIRWLKPVHFQCCHSPSVDKRALWSAVTAQIRMSGHGWEGLYCITLSCTDYVPQGCVGTGQPELPLSEVMRPEVCFQCADKIKASVSCSCLLPL